MWPMPSWTRSWPAAANKACFSKPKTAPAERWKTLLPGRFFVFQRPLRPQFSEETQCKTKMVFQSSTAGKRPPGCGSQHPFRTLSGAHVLLAAAPTAPPCVPPFVAMRHLPPAGGSLWPQAAVVAVALAELGSQSCSADAGCRAPQFSGKCCAKQKRPCRSRAVESSIFRVNQRLLNWGARRAAFRPY